MQAHALRLGPGTDLVPALSKIAGQLFETSSSSCCVLTAVGSLSEVSLRMASATRLKGEEPVTIVKDIEERVEIVSLVGTFSLNGGKHLHMVRYTDCELIDCSCVFLLIAFFFASQFLDETEAF